MCVPRTCTAKDISNILDFSIMLNDNIKINKIAQRSVKITSIKRIEFYYEIKKDASALVLLFFTVVLILLALFATAVDLKLIRLRNPKTMSFNIQNAENTNEALVENRNLDVYANEKCYKSIDAIASQNNFCYSEDNQVKRELNVVDVETLTINNINNSNNINLVTVKKIVKPDANPPSITLDVVAVEDDQANSCRRCGKYRKQCPNPKQLQNLPACPRINSYNACEGVSLNSMKGDRKSLMKGLLLCFSLNYSLKRIFNTNMTNRDLFAMHILKIIATFWMILIHLTMIMSYISGIFIFLKIN